MLARRAPKVSTRAMKRKPPPVTQNRPREIVDRPALALRLARQLRKSDAGGAEHPLLTRLTEDLVERLLTVVRPFDQVALLSPWPSKTARELEKLERIDTVRAYRVLGTDDTCAVDDELLPFAPGSLDLMISVLALQATNDLPGALVQARRSLRPDGLFLGVLFAGQTLTELRACLLEAESALTGGASPRVLPFADVRDLGGLMQRAGFALPVADTDTLQMTYPSPLDLLRELQQYGATNVLSDRHRGFCRRDVLLRAIEIYVERFGDSDGRVPATIDMVTLTGWAPSPDQQQPLKPGSAKSRLADALNVSERPLDPSSDDNG